MRGSRQPLKSRSGHAQPAYHTASRSCHLTDDERRGPASAGNHHDHGLRSCRIHLRHSLRCLLPEDNQYTSSTAIRQNLSLIQNYCPNFVSSQNLFHYEKFYPFFQFQIINNPLPQHPILANGLDKHLKKSAKDANSFAELLKYATNSYFTTTKIKRAIFYLLFNVNPFSNYYPYSRVLGFNSRGQNYLRQIKKQSKIITNNKMDLSPILDYELKIASIFDLIFASHCLSDELKEPIIIK